MKLFFCLQIKLMFSTKIKLPTFYKNKDKVFYKVTVTFWLCVTRLAHSNQTNKFEISLQYLKENGKNEVDFLLADKHQIFVQIDTIILGVCGQACPNYTKR